MKFLSILIGVLLIIAGLFFYQNGGINYQEQDKVLDLGSLTAYSEETSRVPVGPVVSAAIIGGGLILLLYGFIPRKS